MRKPIAAVMPLILLMAGLGCSGIGMGPACGGRGQPTCISLTVTALRNAAWNEYCLSQPNCTRAVEGMQVQLGPESASRYSGYDPAELACSDVTMTLEDGSTVTRHFVISGFGDEEFQIIEEVDVDICLEMEN